jgi:inosine-uridine nucleoside N-ribohydrolase
MEERTPIVWDMETGDPDDFLTLLMLLDHPRVDLRAVTVTPGSPWQIGVVRHGLALLDRDLPVGAYDITRTDREVSDFHYHAFGDIPPSTVADPAVDVLLEHVDEQTTLLTGGPNQNLAAALAADPAWRLGAWVCQGGFAGEGVVPRNKQLPQFAGLTTCPSWNLNGDPAAVEQGLAHEGIGIRRFVSKNVCHGVIYDGTMHERFEAVRHGRRSLELVWAAMTGYLAQRPSGKKFHDPLAFACAVDPSIGRWAEVELYSELPPAEPGQHAEPDRYGGSDDAGPKKRRRWGSRPAEGTRTWIITDHDHERFLNTLLAPA